jgi:hypothetical protein
MYTYTHIHMYTHRYVHTYIHTHIHTYMHALPMFVRRTSSAHTNKKRTKSTQATGKAETYIHKRTCKCVF